MLDGPDRGAVALDDEPPQRERDVRGVKDEVELLAPVASDDPGEGEGEVEVRRPMSIALRQLGLLIIAKPQMP